MLMQLGRGISPAQNLFASPLQMPQLTTFIEAQSSALTYSAGSGDGASIATIADLSGNGKNFADAGGTNKFIYKTSGLHGKPAWRMNGGKALLDSPDGLYDADLTVIVWFSAAEYPLSAGAVPIYLVASNSTCFVNYLNDTVNYGPKETGGYATVSSPSAITDLVMVALTFKSNAEASLWVNGVSASFNPDDRYDDNGYVRIGTTSASTSAGLIEVYGLMVSNKALTSVQLQSLYQWGKARYK